MMDIIELNKIVLAGNKYGKVIILNFDDSNADSIKEKGLDKDGNIIIDENSAAGVLETFKKSILI